MRMKNEQIKVSIVIPCYNAEKYIAQCLESIIAQTYKEVEILCVDDGSVDATREIIGDYANKDKRITLICQENLYAGIARNNGMAHATGSYLVFLDSDDYFKADMIESMLESALKWDSDIVLCDAYYLNSQTGAITKPSWVLRTSCIPSGKPVFNHKDVPKNIFDIAMGVPWNKMFKTDFVKAEQLEFQNTQRCNDEYFAGMSMVLAKRVSYVDKRLVYYRTNNGNSLQGYDRLEAPSLDFFHALKKMQKELRERKLFEEVSSAFCNKCVSVCVAALHKQTVSDKFEYVYNFLKDTGFEQLGLDSIEDIHINREEFSDIKKYTPLQYLFYHWKKLQQSGGEIYPCPFATIGSRKKVALYAAGVVGRSYYRQLILSDYYQLVGWFDKNYHKYAAEGKPVLNPKDIPAYDFDVIVVAVENERVREDITSYLIEMGVSKEKIVFNEK